MNPDAVLPTDPSSPRLLDVIGHLYEAASDLSRWGDFLRAACRLFDAPYANLVHYDPAHPELSLSLLTGFERFPLERLQWAAAKQLELRDEDPRFLYCRTHPYKPITCTEIMPTERFRETRVYRELLSIAGIEYSLMVQYADDNDKFTGVSFLRGTGQIPFSPHETELLGELLPHLRLAFSIQQKLTRIDHRLQASYQVLENLPTGIAITGDDGHVEFANRAAHHIFALDDGIALHDGVIQLQGMQTAELLTMIREAGDSGEHRALPVARYSGAAPFQCLVTRLPQPTVGDAPNLLARTKVALFLSNPEQPIETSEELLQRMFGLTGAEARVLERLVAGLTPENIAAANGVALSTVRSQIRSIHAKMGCTNQVELVQRVLASPIWVAQRKAG